MGRSRRGGMAVGLGIAALLAWPVHGQPGGGPPPASVVVDAARTETVEQWREVTGELRAVRRTLLAAQEEGFVVDVLKQEGDRVSAGETVARLHDVRARLDVDRATADVAARKAMVDQRDADAEKTRRDLERIEEMVARGAGNERERDNARTDLKTAVARLEQAKAELAAAEAQLGLASQRLRDMAIDAPFAGVLVTRRSEVGQWLKRGDSVAEIVAMDQIEAWLDVPERYIDRLARPEQRVQVRVAALGRTFEAPVVAIIPDADRLSRLYPVRARMRNDDERLRPGMSVTGQVPTGTSEPTMTIRKDAVLRDDAGEFVYFDDGGVAAVARIQVLFAAGDRLAVRSARLAPGTLVVVEGNERLFPSQPLMIREGGPGGG